MSELAFTGIPTLSQLVAAGFRDINGNLLAGGSVGWSETSAELYTTDLYTDPNLNRICANPFKLDSRGTALIYGRGRYNLTVMDAAGNTIWTFPTQIGTEEAVEV